MTNLALKLEPVDTALTFVENGQVLTNSKTVSSVFNKRHCDVLEAIKRLEIPEDLRKRNFPLTFNEVKMPNGAIRKDPCYNLTKDGFVLLVMGFTGKKAMAFKIKYIEAFNAMERALAAAPAPALDAKAIGGIVKKCAAKAVKDELENISARLDFLADHFSVLSALLADKAKAERKDIIEKDYRVAEAQRSFGNDKSRHVIYTGMTKPEYDLICWCRGNTIKPLINIV